MCIDTSSFSETSSGSPSGACPFQSRRTGGSSARRSEGSCSSQGESPDRRVRPERSGRSNPTSPSVADVANRTGGRCSEAVAFEWDELVARSPRLRRVVAAMVRSFGHRPTADKVDEVVQECFLRMLSSRTFSREACHRTMIEAEVYFRRVARAVLVDEMRGSGAAKRGGHGVIRVDCELLEDKRVNPLPNPEDELVEKDSHQRISRRLRRALEPTYSARDCRLLEAVVLDEERPCDLARRSKGKLSEGAAYIALHRMRRHLTSLGREEFLS